MMNEDAKAILALAEETGSGFTEVNRQQLLSAIGDNPKTDALKEMKQSCLITSAKKLCIHKDRLIDAFSGKTNGNDVSRREFPTVDNKSNTAGS